MASAAGAATRLNTNGLLPGPAQPGGNREPSEKIHQVERKPERLRRRESTGGYAPAVRRRLGETDVLQSASSENWESPGGSRRWRVRGGHTQGPGSGLQTG
jgi:hypothetical protein